MSIAHPQVEFTAVPMTDSEQGYDYPERVRFDVPQEDRAAYTGAARFLNMTGVDLVCLQHEFGIFGGPAGSHILDLIDTLEMPIVTTLHTVLRDPKPEQRLVMDALVRRSDRLVVMSERARRYVRDIYYAPDGKIDLIPHGVPDTPLIDPEIMKRRFGLVGKRVLLTFGLLSPNKGVEQVIRALPRIVAAHPNVVYVVLGDVHPKIRARDGDAYLQGLRSLARELGVEQHVWFDSRFVDLSELVDLLGATDVYVTPYLNQAQIVSGTLAYAVGMGKAVVSTPYWYAEELLANGRGRIVPFGDAEAIASEVTLLLGDDAMRNAICRRAYRLGRTMIWSQLAHEYMASFDRAVAGGVAQTAVAAVAASADPAA